MLTSGLSSAPLSAWIRQGSSLPPSPRRPHNASSLPRRCRQAAAEAEGKTEGPHSSRANNCPQCTNKTTALEARGRPKGQVPCARSGQPGTPRGRGARAQLHGEAKPPEEPPRLLPPCLGKQNHPGEGLKSHQTHSGRSARTANAVWLPPFRHNLFLLIYGSQ